MEAIILCGGKGTRLREISKEKPKSLVEVAGVPFLERQLQILEKNKFKHVIISAGYLHEQIGEFINARNNTCKITLAVETDPLLTGGATKYAMQFCDEVYTYVLFGDSYFDVDFISVQNTYKKANKKGLISATRGNQTVNNLFVSTNEVFSYGELYCNAADSGVSIFDVETFLNFLPQKFTLGEYYKYLLRADQLAVHMFPHRFYEIGTPESLAETEGMILEK